LVPRKVCNIVIRKEDNLLKSILGSKNSINSIAMVKNVHCNAVETFNSWEIHDHQESLRFQSVEHSSNQL